MFKIILLLIHIFIGILCIIIFPLINRKTKKFLIKRWSSLLLKIFKINLVVNNDLKKILRKKNYLIVSNHISWLDIFVINSACPVAFVAKQSISKWPILSWLVKASETIFIDRKRITKIKETSKEVENFLKNKGSICIFPEGTSTDGSQLLNFKSNLLQTAINKSISVLPIAIQYFHNQEFCSAPAYHADLSLLDSIRNLIKLNNIEAKLTILKEIKSISDRKVIANEAYVKISRVII
jgi:1-acyl-sn-glycerol-3-phosphate acyltransferase